MAHGGLGPEELEEADALAEAATPGPWHVRFFDDDVAMNIVAIATTADDGADIRYPEFDQGEIVAATLIQHPRYVDIVDGRWDENARFIAASRELVPKLIAEVKRLRALLDS
jgi:hypothetical protein